MSVEILVARCSHETIGLGSKDLFGFLHEREGTE
jgi:hypothetical protein